MIKVTPVLEGESGELEQARQKAQNLIEPPTVGVQATATPAAASPTEPTAPAAVGTAAPAPAVPNPNAAPPAPSGAENQLPAGFVELTRREGVLTRREIELKNREEKVSSREGSMADLQEEARQDPLSAMEKIGLSYEGVTDFVVNRNDPKGGDDNSALAREMKALQGAVSEIKDGQAATATQYERTAKMGELQRVLDNDPKLELTKFHGQEALNLALAVQEQSLKETGALPAPDAVLGQVEDYYLKKASDAAMLPKVQSALQPSAPQPTPPAQPGAVSPPASTGALEAPAPAADPSNNPTSQEGQPAATAAPDPSASSRTLTNAQSSNAAPAQPATELLTDEAYREKAEEVLLESYKEGN